MSTSTTHDQPVTLSAYQEGLTRAGLKCYRGTSGDLWMSHEIGSMVRVPLFQVHPPSEDDIDHLFWKLRVAAVTYNVESDENHRPNARLYVCKRENFSFENLSSSPRRNIRIAQKNLQFGFVAWDTLLKHGAEAYRDTRQRNGLSDGTLKAFQAHFSVFSRVPGMSIVGAWQGDTLAAFLSLIVVDKWVEVMGTFLANQYRRLHAIEGLYAFLFDHFLIQCGADVIDSGLSSIQQVNNMASLHTFKQNIGFEAKPVHRVFVLHPLIRPFGNSLSLTVFEMIQKFAPKNRRIRKATGMLDFIVNDKELPDMDEKTNADSSSSGEKI